VPTAHPTSKILLSGLLALTSLVAACGDDDDDVAAPVTTADAADDAPDPDHPYCEHEREIDSHFEAAFSRLGDDASEADQRAAAQSAAKSVVDAGIMEDALAAAPDHLREDLELLSSNVRAAAAGDVDVFFTEESDAAGRRIDTFCGLED
jgi:hypothetical protein